jgi:nucleoside-diphosphate-sugar epimerase
MYPSSEKPLKEEDFDPGRGLFPKYFGVGWTKVYLEKMCEFYSRIGRTRFMAIRHSNIYGPHDKFDPVLLFGQVNIIQGRANDRVISERKQIRKMKILQNIPMPVLKIF